MLPRVFSTSGALVLVLLGAAVLRFGVVDYGLPQLDLYGDEAITSRLVSGVLVEHARQSPDWLNTGFWRWPNLNVYMSAASIKAAEKLVSKEKLGLTSKEYMYVIGRSMTALIGLLTIWFVYLIGSRLFDRRCGVVAAGLLAVMPLHVEYSHHWVTDAPVAMFYTLTLLLSVRLLERPSLLRFVLAGVALGAATATKYNGVAACFCIAFAALAAHSRFPARRRWPRLVSYVLLAGLVSVVMFHVFDPYAFLEREAFLEELTADVSEYTGEPSAGFLGWRMAAYVLIKFFDTDIGPVMSVLALLGAGLSLKRRSAAAVVLLGSASMYLVTFALPLRIAITRNFLALLPIAALLASVAAVQLAELVERGLARRWPGLKLASGLLASLLCVLAVKPAGQVFALKQQDTRVAALNWMAEHLPQGSSVLWERGMRHPSLLRHPTHKFPVALYEFTPEEMAASHDYIVPCGYNYDWVLRQRARPGFTERAQVYDELFTSPSFERVAKFESGPLMAGPEVQIFRTVIDRGNPRLIDGKVELKGQLWGNDWRLSKKRDGIYRLERPWDAVAGPVLIEAEGRYRFSVGVYASHPYRIALELAGRQQTFLVEGESEVAVEAELEPGQVWWSVSATEPLPQDSKVVFCCLTISLK